MYDQDTAKTTSSIKEQQLVQWDPMTRLLHFGLAFTVSLQLLFSLVMASPDEQHVSVLASAALEIHKLWGMIALIIVSVHWIWTLFKRSNGGIRHLFPWDAAGRCEVTKDARALFAGRIPEGGPRAGLPGFIRGLGFLAVSSMVVTGGILFISLPEHGEIPASTAFVAEMHEYIGVFVWGYWIAHVIVALIHHRMGHSLLTDMFTPD